MEWTLLKEGILYKEFTTKYNDQDILNRHLKAVEGYSIYKITDETPSYSKLIYLSISEDINNYEAILDNEIIVDENEK